MHKKIGVRSSIAMLHILDKKTEKSMSAIKLTPRGKEVFQLVLTGLNDIKIADRLGITYSGVRRHREKMLLANRCDTMLELVAKYHNEGAKLAQVQRLVFLLNNMVKSMEEESGEPSDPKTA